MLSYPFSLKIFGLCDFSAIPSGESQVFHPTESVSVEITDRVEDYIYRKMRVYNESDTDSEILYDPYVIDAKIPCEKAAHLCSLHGDDCTERVFFPEETDISIGQCVTLEPCGGRSSSTTAFPFFDLTIDGRSYFFAVGWTGQWICRIVRTEKHVEIKIGNKYASFYIKPNESFDLCSVCIVEGDDAHAVRRRFKTILRDEITLMKYCPSLPFAVQPFDRYFYGKHPGWDTEEGQLKTLAAAKKISGIDTLWLDAAWFKTGFPRGVGNITYADGFPNGLGRVADAVHSENMRFVMWFEPERVAKDTDIFRENPEFLLKSESSQRLLNLGDPDAWRSTFETLARFIEENGVDVFRQDFNMDPLPFWLENDEPMRRGVTEIRHINGLYALWDALREKFPKILIDDCSSGGRRIDLETMRRAVPLWRSDVGCFPASCEKPTDIWNQNQTLALSEFLPYHATAVWEARAYDVRSSMSGGIACAFDVLGASFDFNAASESISEAASVSKYFSCDFYQLTSPSLSNDCFCAYQAGDENDGFAAVFRREECEDESFVLKLNRIDPHAEYKIVISDEYFNKSKMKIAGDVLQFGFEVYIRSKRASVIVKYEKDGHNF